MVDSAAAPPTPPAPRRMLRRVLIALFGLLLLLCAALWLAVGSETGSAWLLARVPLVTATQPTGRLFGGAFSAQRVEVRAGPRLIVLDKLAWHDARWAWRPHDGAWFGLVIDGASVEHVQVGAATASTPAVEPQTLRLPLALTVSELRIAALQIDGAPALRDIATRIELGHDAGRQHRVPSLSLRTDRASASGSARIAADAPFAVDAQAQATSVDGAAHPWRASAKAAGPLAAITVDAQLSSPQAAGAQLDARATVSPFAAWPLSQLQASTQALDLSALFAEAPQTQIAGQARIDTQGLDKPITASIKLTNAQPGRWDEKRLPLAELELDITGRADQRDRLTLRRFELRAPGDGGGASGQGEWKGGTATLDITLQALRPSLLDNRAPAMTLSGTLGSRWLGLPSPDGTAVLSTTLQLQSRLALEGKLDKPRNDSVRIDGALQAQRSPDGWRIELNDAQARAGNASLRGALQAERNASGATQLKTQGQAQGFDPAQWWAASAERALERQLEGRSAGARVVALRGQQRGPVVGAAWQGGTRRAGQHAGRRAAASHAARRRRRERLERRCDNERRQQQGLAAGPARRARRR
jgi:translocation and assembly module TamB